MLFGPSDPADALTSQVVRLAKRKADELEETFDDSDSKVAKYTSEEIAEGTALAAEMLRAWNERVDAEATEAAPPATQDSTMGEDGAMSKAKEEKLQKQLELLRETFEGFKPRIEASRWASEALLETY